MSWQEQGDERTAQPAPAGFTRIQNKLLETLALARLTASESRCLFFLLRKT